MIIKFKNFTKLNSEEKKLVLTWRNSDRIRLKMINKDIISLENHLKYIDSLKNRKNCEYYLCYIDETPIGVMDYTDIKKNGNCHAGSYIGDTAFNGFGILLGYYSFEYHFKRFTNSIIYTEVLKTNKRVYDYNKKIFNSIDLREDNEFYYMYNTFESWNNQKEKLKELVVNPLNIEDVIYD